MSVLDPQEVARRNEKLRRYWAKEASRYDKSMGFFERQVFGRRHRPWACSRATGRVLEVGIGTGLNLPHYPVEANITGLDLSPEMLEIARARARELGRDIDLREGDAHDLPYPDGSFDTVVSTYSLCNIPDVKRAVTEMKRVLRRGGKLILVDHIRSSVRPVLWLQKIMEFATVRLQGDHQTRRPGEDVVSAGFNMIVRDRLGPAGVVERLVAVKDA